MDDLISRAAVKQAFIQYKNDMKVLTPFELNRLVDLFAIIKDLPAVDAVPVVHGRWILHDDELMPWFECSECGWSFGNAEKFCAGCGAKMDAHE